MVGRPASGQTPYQQVDYRNMLFTFGSVDFACGLASSTVFLTVLFQCKRSLTVVPTQSNHCVLKGLSHERGWAFDDING
jgi:hypothetical protein